MRAMREAIVACWLLLLWPSATFAGTVTPGAAIPSTRATESLLLDVARAGDRVVAVGEWGHVVLSDDGGRSWRQANSVPTRATLTGVCFADEKKGWAVGHDSVVLHTADGGEVWELQHAAPQEEAPLLSVWFENADHGLAAGAFGLVLETRDGGKTWKRMPPVGRGEDDRHLNDLFAGPDGALFIAAEYGTVYRSDDGGISWEDLHPPYPGSFWGGLTLPDGAVLVFGMRGHVFRSDDLGETWTEIQSGTRQSLGGATQLADGRIVVVGLGGAIVSSADGGKTFSAAIRPDRRGIAAVTEGADGALLLFGETGVAVASP